MSAIWSPDCARVVFASNRKGSQDLYVKQADGSGAEEVLLHSPEIKRPNSWSPDGRFLLYNSAMNNGDLMVPDLELRLHALLQDVKQHLRPKLPVSLVAYLRDAAYTAIREWDRIAARRRWLPATAGLLALAC